MHASDSGAAGRRRTSPTMIPLGSGIGISPVTVSAMVVKTAAAILVTTLNACVKMSVAKILVANNT